MRIEVQKGALVIPIASTIPGHGLEVTVAGKTVTGVALPQYQRTIDYVARRLQFVQHAGTATVNAARQKARAIPA